MSVIFMIKVMICRVYLKEVLVFASWLLSKTEFFQMCVSLFPRYCYEGEWLGFLNAIKIFWLKLQHIFLKILGSGDFLLFLPFIFCYAKANHPHQYDISLQLRPVGNRTTGLARGWLPFGSPVSLGYKGLGHTVCRMRLQQVEKNEIFYLLVYPKVLWLSWQTQYVASFIFISVLIRCLILHTRLQTSLLYWGLSCYQRWSFIWLRWT